MEQYNNMSRAELKDELIRLKNLLDEVIEEREMIFSTTGIHRSVAYQVEKYEQEIGDLKKKIEYISNLLKK